MMQFAGVELKEFKRTSILTMMSLSKFEAYRKCKERYKESGIHSDQIQEKHIL